MPKLNDTDKTMLSIHYNILKNGMGAFDIELHPWFAKWIREQGKDPGKMIDVFCNAVGTAPLKAGILALNKELNFIPELNEVEQ